MSCIVQFNELFSWVIEGRGGGVPHIGDAMQWMQPTIYESAWEVSCGPLFYYNLGCGHP